MAAAERPGRRPGQHAAVHRRARLRLRRDARLAGPGAGRRARRSPAAAAAASPRTSGCAPAGPTRRTGGRAGSGCTRVRWCSPTGRSRRSSPRVLEDMFWLGRYAERTEDLTRLLIVARERVDDFRFRPEHLGAGCVPVLLDAVAEVSGTAGFAPGRRPAAADPGADARRHRGRHRRAVAGRAAGIRPVGARPALRRHLDGARRHRPGGRRARPTTPGDGGMALASTQAAVLSGMLALSGLASENMVRDPGWYFMDIGRRLERAQQVTALLRATLTRSHSSAVDSLVVESVLAASESGRHLPAPLPRPDPGGHHARTAAAGRRQPAVAGLPGRAGQGGPAGPARLVRHLAAAAAAGGRRGHAAPRPTRRTSTGSTRTARRPELLALLDGLTNPSAGSPMPLPRNTSGTRARCSRSVSSPMTG